MKSPTGGWTPHISKKHQRSTSWLGVGGGFCSHHSQTHPPLPSTPIPRLPTLRLEPGSLVVSEPPASQQTSAHPPHGSTKERVPASQAPGTPRGAAGLGPGGLNLKASLSPRCWRAMRCVYKARGARAGGSSAGRALSRLPGRCLLRLGGRRQAPGPSGSPLSSEAAASAVPWR